MYQKEKTTKEEAEKINQSTEEADCVDHSGTGTSTSLTSGIKAHQPDPIEANNEEWLEKITSRKERDVIKNIYEINSGITRELIYRGTDNYEEIITLSDSYDYLEKGLNSQWKKEVEKQLAHNRIDKLEAIYAERNFRFILRDKKINDGRDSQKVRNKFLHRLFITLVEPNFTIDKEYKKKVLGWLLKEEIEKVEKEQRSTMANFLACVNNAEGLEFLFEWHREHNNQEKLKEWYSETFSQEQPDNDFFAHLADGIANEIENSQIPDAGIISVAFYNFEKFKKLSLQETLAATSPNIREEKNESQKSKKNILRDFLFCKLYSDQELETETQNFKKSLNNHVKEAVVNQYQLFKDQLEERTELTDSVVVELTNCDKWIDKIGE